jgi:hypothetical protein
VGVPLCGSNTDDDLTRITFIIEDLLLAEKKVVCQSRVTRFVCEKFAQNVAQPMSGLH